MTGKELYQLFETEAKIIIKLISEIEIINKKDRYATISNMEVRDDIVIISIDENEFGNDSTSEIHCKLNEEIQGFKVISNTAFIAEYRNSDSNLSYRDWLMNKIFGKNYETITLELEDEDYKKLQEIAKENNTTIENIVNRLLELCVKENGLVVWKDGFENPYTVLRTREEIKEWIDNEN